MPLWSWHATTPLPTRFWAWGQGSSYGGPGALAGNAIEAGRARSANVMGASPLGKSRLAPTRGALAS
jgi:hypothetical protein